MDSEQFKQEAEKIEQSLSALRVAERNAVIPFMNGDFTQWDLYLASSSEYAMRLIDGFISMLESRNLVCVASFSAHRLESACGHSHYSPPKTRMTFSSRCFKVCL